MKNVKKIISAALITLFATSLIGCNMIEKTPEGIAKTEVAKVFDTKITKGQIDAQLPGVIKQLQTQYGANYTTNTDAMTELTTQKQKVLAGLINEEIVTYKAKELKLVPTDAKLNAEINKQLLEIKKSLGTDAKYKAALTQAGITEEALKARIKPSVIQDALKTEATKNVKVTDAEAKAYYNANLALYSTKPNTIHLAHILVKTEEEAVAIKKRLDAGEDFAKLAKEKGTDGTKAAGGELGTFKFDDTSMDATFMAAAIKVPAGKVSAPVKTQFGYHLIKDVARTNYPAKKFEVVKAEVEKTLLAKNKETAWTAAMTKWTTEANVTKIDKNL
ncbi:peptidylprolyl isomerase [Clostridium estertheticum]|uniref:peptidylprolyl isomerase n=1 Tax=Clostridium estertheticum TaxID=238834 RepID=UPI001CF2EAC8|nr:peptidylprolyl isomerase [Clostridium estertheticum]MCB2307797.1 peptidylprolyl isomerase [Clostridium estertheticum]MCB2345405.1 peptidylprolyl isomerase [Clostridium estertheticum]MCB2350747.1 peptidylprolyl isomerase [Clostridium estertheticum]WAG47113.1 peptidylprolyl isomerase [Clostridium estertheticum]